MPLFEFICKKCGKKFEKLVFSTDNEKLKCPECNSEDVEKQFSTFSANSSGSAKSGGHHCCNGCCHHH
ncbi:MAG: zinc ribbon domain-containing protein [Elusimicrobia bacterium]|nr:zinc ribbon domain-containing protein [Elusimicrobiota bacterium]